MPSPSPLPLHRAAAGAAAAIVAASSVHPGPALGLASLELPAPSPSQSPIVRTVPVPESASLKALSAPAIPDRGASVADIVRKVAPATVTVNGLSVETEKGKSSLVGTVGSGFIIKVGSDFCVITNAHVVTGRQIIDVTLADQRIVDVEVVGSDTVSDIAVLRLKGKGQYPTVTLGDSREVSQGDPVIAVGSPHGLQGSVSAGILSGLNRSVSLLGGSTVFQMLQTDAPINPGNSGGPLVNSQGEVIGINTSHLENLDGVSFAIPITPAKRVINQILQHGYATHGFLGAHIAGLRQHVVADAIQGGIVPAWVAEVRARNESEQGALVLQIEKNTPAARAGITPGDVITRINGQLISDDGSLRAAVAEKPPGEIVELEIIRNDRVLRVSVPLGKRREQGGPFLAQVPIQGIG